MPAKRIVVLGGGFGGAFTAKYLRQRVSPDVVIELINDTNYFVFRPLLPEVAAGIIGAADSGAERPADTARAARASR